MLVKRTWTQAAPQLFVNGRCWCIRRRDVKQVKGFSDRSRDLRLGHSHYPEMKHKSLIRFFVCLIWKWKTVWSVANMMCYYVVVIYYIENLTNVIENKFQNFPSHLVICLLITFIYLFLVWHLRMILRREGNH